MTEITNLWSLNICAPGIKFIYKQGKLREFTWTNCGLCFGHWSLDIEI